MRSRLAALAAAAALLVVGCGEARPAASATASSSSTRAASTATPASTSSAAAAAIKTGAPAQVVDVVDGDTLDVRLDGKVQRVRLILVDTPEVFGGVQCYGREASTYTKSLLPAGTALRLERDVSETDRFGRLLRYAYLDDGRLVNEVLVRDGYGRVATFPPDLKLVERMRAAEREARDARRGLWGGCETPTATPSAASTPFASCAAARAAGAAPVRRGQPGYNPGLDGDADGIACE
ncbi:MAG: thermonuclease family protein [Dehalococcoidia bacterium]